MSHFGNNARKKPLGFLLFLIITLFTPFASSYSSNQPLQPRYVTGVSSIIDSHEYIRQHAAPIYWKMSPFYVSQRNDTSCSLASATMLVNASRINDVVSANQELATQDKLLAKVNDKTWAKGVAPDGDGITLDQMYSFLPKALEAYGVHHFNIEVVHVNNTPKDADQLHAALVNMENTGNSFIVANFDQNFFSGSMVAGHFSPIGAYDAENKRVLIMDVDRALYEPYWAPEKLVLESMATEDSSAHKNRGYLVVSFTH
jgi:hypothetical protein